ncbi:MAG: nucleotide sugar dehydrogenase [Deltaproteobacteria bacterium]|jgi:UDP-N-acetyl-D-glucosamine dehydrogenase|nr:nucleotide sugar dehydrogenase [Deltaproteobacteria bacterium]
MKNKIDQLKKKIIDHDFTIGVVGLGYVGLPLIVEFGKKGFRVIGFDIDQLKVDKLLAGESYIEHIGSELTTRLLNTGKFEPTVDFAKIAEVDAVIICVPTPLNRYREPEMKYIRDTCTSIKDYLQENQIIALESTTYPGTTEEVMKPILEQNPSGLKADQDFYLVYSPEREDPGNKNFSTSTIPKVVGGSTPESLELGNLLYSQIIEKTVPVSSLKTAEMTKLVENIYRNINIALVNELKMLADRMDINIWEVIKAASTKPFGFHPFYPGPGLGGHCIPIDPFYLTWKAREYNFPTRFIELAGEINAKVTEFVRDKVVEALNSKEKSLKGAKILILGMAYKRDIDDLRESPSLKLMELLEKGGAKVEYNDPHIPQIPKVSPMRNYKFIRKSVPLSSASLAKYDLALIVTDHSSYDFEAIVENSNLVVDTRNATSQIKKGQEKIWTA